MPPWAAFTNFVSGFRFSAIIPPIAEAEHQLPFGAYPAEAVQDPQQGLANKGQACGLNFSPTNTVAP
jgi:hypothetical protein